MRTGPRALNCPCTGWGVPVGELSYLVVRHGSPPQSNLASLSQLPEKGAAHASAHPNQPRPFCPKPGADSDPGLSWERHASSSFLWLQNPADPQHLTNDPKTNDIPSGPFEMAARRRARGSQARTRLVASCKWLAPSLAADMIV